MDNLQVNVSEEIKNSVVKSLPMVMEIKGEDLREKVIEAWALSLSLNGYSCLEELPGSGRPGGIVKGNQTHHLLGVTKIAMAMVSVFEEVYGEPLETDKDLLLAAALCHDLGKPYEYNPKNRERWDADPRVSGRPALRHTLYGVHIALTVGLPEAVVHACGCHSPEGELVTRSLGTTIIHFADEAFWSILKSADKDWVSPK